MDEKTKENARQRRSPLPRLSISIKQVSKWHRGNLIIKLTWFIWLLANFINYAFIISCDNFRVGKGGEGLGGEGRNENHFSKYLKNNFRTAFSYEKDDVMVTRHILVIRHGHFPELFFLRDFRRQNDFLPRTTTYCRPIDVFCL